MGTRQQKQIKAGQKCPWEPDPIQAAVSEPVQEPDTTPEVPDKTEGAEPPADAAAAADSQTEPASGNKDGWDQAFYETLTLEQKKVYENCPDASYRNMMQQEIEKKRQRGAEGWIVEAGAPTEEQLEKAWGNMTFGH